MYKKKKLAKKKHRKNQERLKALKVVSLSKAKAAIFPVMNACDTPSPENPSTRLAASPIRSPHPRVGAR